MKVLPLFFVAYSDALRFDVEAERVWNVAGETGAGFAWTPCSTWHELSRSRQDDQPSVYTRTLRGVRVVRLVSHDGYAVQVREARIIPKRECAAFALEAARIGALPFDAGLPRGWALARDAGNERVAVYSEDGISRFMRGATCFEIDT